MRSCPRISPLISTPESPLSLPRFKLTNRYTQRGGVRPFGVSSILAGFGPDGKPLIYQIDPSGTYFSWKANAIGGKNSKGMREFLEKEWAEGLAERDALKLTVKALLEVVDSGSKNMELVVVRDGKAMAPVEEAYLEELTAEVVAEAEALKNEGAPGAQEMKD